MRKLLEIFLNNKLLVNIIVILMVLVGLYSVFNIQQDVFPEVEMDMMMVTVVYPGASPSDVEVNAVVPIEREIAKISGINYYTSLSIENTARIMINIDSDVDNKQAVKDEVFRSITIGNISNLPDELERIQIVDMNPKMKEVYSIAVFPNDTVFTSESELYKFIDRLEQQLLRISGVSDVRLSGYRDREIHINVNPNSADKLQVSLNEIVNSIQARNIRSTGGTLQSLFDEQTIVTLGQFNDPLDVGDVIIRSNFTGKRVRIKDIANIEDGFKDEFIKIRVNNRKAVVFDIVKNENADIIATVENVKRFLQRNKTQYSDRYDIRVVSDLTFSIRALLKVVKTNAILGFILVIIILLIFLDFKTAFWTAFGLPLSMLMVFFFMNIAGYTLNMISLLAIITVVGMLVDDGIVIAESVYVRKLAGMSPSEAAIEGTMAVIKPVTVAVLTTIVAFLPLLIISGRMGKFISIFPIIVTAMLLVSLLEATFILPNHLAHSKIRKLKEKNWFQPIANIYERFLRKLLKLRYLVIIVFIAVFIGTIIFSMETIKNMVLMFGNPTEVININLKAPKGISLDAMTELTEIMEKDIINNIPHNILVSTMVKVGTQQSKPMNYKGDYENWSTIAITLVPVSERSKATVEIIADLRNTINIDSFPQFTEIQALEEKMGPPMGKAFDIRIVGDNNKDVDSVRAEMEAFLATFNGVKNIENNQIEGKKELVIKCNYKKLAELGLTVQDVALTVRTAYEGRIATSIETISEKLDFRVKVSDSFKKDERFLLRLLIPNRSGRLIRLGDVAYIERCTGKANINHYNGNRTITVTADIDDSITTSMKLTQRVMKQFHDVSKRFPGVYLEIGGEAEQMKEVLPDLAFAFLMAILLIYFLMVFEFKSLSQPLMILVTIPFGIIGALLAFTIHGLPLTFMGIIGITGLCGIVVNDSIIMVDFINKEFKKNTSASGKSFIPIITEGAKQRLRPVILTTVTTAGGLLPTVYGIGGSSQMIIPVVMAIAYGLMFATTLTLIFTPSLYMVNADIKRLFRIKQK
jgi:multidrug efflux pump subunit AcrB